MYGEEVEIPAAIKGSCSWCRYEMIGRALQAICPSAIPAVSLLARRAPPSASLRAVSDTSLDFLGAGDDVVDLLHRTERHSAHGWLAGWLVLCSAIDCKELHT